MSADDWSKNESPGWLSTHTLLWLIFSPNKHDVYWEKRFTADAGSGCFWAAIARLFVLLKVGKDPLHYFHGLRRRDERGCVYFWELGWPTFLKDRKKGIWNVAVWYRFAEKNMYINGNMHKKQLAQNNTSQGNCRCQTNQFARQKSYPPCMYMFLLLKAPYFSAAPLPE